MQTILKIILLLVFLTILPPTGIRAQILEEPTTISLSVKDVSLNNVLKIISKKSGLSFIPDPKISEIPITVELSETNPLKALEIITQLYNLGFQELKGTGKYVVTELWAIDIETVVGLYTCEFAPAESLVPVIGGLLTPEAGSVLIDERTNTIIYKDTEENNKILRQIISQLDRPSKQVHIKSVIAEISLSKSTDTGVQWFTNSENIAIGTDFGIKTVPLELPDTPERPKNTGLGIGLLDLNIDVAISALSTLNDLNLLSSPYLMTMDNQWATIEVGDQIPYQKLNEYGITSYEFKDATIKLRIRPKINNDSTITIYLEPQANFQQGFTPDGVPIIATRSAKTQVIVESGKTVVIGGIMQESDVVNETQVPILGSIPIIGKFFKSQRITKQKTELVIMLMPEIVDSDYSSLVEDVTKNFPEKMKGDYNEQE